jgi:hypothetical protein
MRCELQYSGTAVTPSSDGIQSRCVTESAVLAQAAVQAVGSMSSSHTLQPFEV